MAAETISVQDASTKLGELVRRALSGDEIIIADVTTPPVRLVPVASADQPRIAGLNRGEIWTSDDFDDPLPDSFWLGTT